jgi:hypothetical protein
MQTKFALPDLTGKSLDRGDSGNTGITWTDGLYVRRDGSGGRGWDSHLIIQRIGVARGTTYRAPLRPGPGESRTSVFAALESGRTLGPVALRGLDLTWVPGGVPRGPSDGERSRDYLALVARGALEWELADSTTGLLGLELGYAPTAPMIPDPDEAPQQRADGATAVQIAASLVDIVPGHSLGLVYGQAEEGWLVSPDFRPGERLMEVRYRWQLHPGHRLEARARRRTPLESSGSPSGGETDFYLRCTHML